MVGLLGSHLISLVLNGPNGECKQDQIPLVITELGQEFAETSETSLVPKRSEEHTS